VSPSPFAALAVAGLGLLAIATPAGAAAPREQHCVVDVIGQEPDGELLLSEPTCYRTFDQAQADARVAPASDGASTQALTASSVLAVHYDGPNFTGSSITVSGTTCGGGYTNLTTDWRNRISSSLNGCSVVRFFDGLNLTGANESQFASGNLVFLNNRADSVRYG
jgi:hypothetical protein